MLFPTTSASAETEITVATSALEQLTGRSTTGRWDSLRDGQLQWLPEFGFGFFNVTASPADAGYFAHYSKLADTSIGRKLNACRITMLKRHWPNGTGVVDIGVGAGTFIESLPGCLGYDVTPDSVSWLKERGLFVDPYKQPIDVATIWDCLEHIHDPIPLLNNVRKLVVTSLPIFSGPDHVIRSKHYKKAEHCWYWTERGLIWFMARCGWQCLESNGDERRIGREDIRSYAFVRT
jgi:hypothetical protein